MKHVQKLAAPIAIAVIGLLTLGTGTAVAAHHLITGKDIKNHSVGYVDLSKSAVKKLHGANGKRGPRGPSGDTATNWYAGHIQSLNTAQDSTGYGMPIGFSTSQSSTGSFADVLGPTSATTLTSMNVLVTNAPGTGSLREFALVINGSPTSVNCTILPAGTTCGVTLNVAIPANAVLYVDSAVTGATAVGADAAFSWTTKG